MKEIKEIVRELKQDKEKRNKDMGKECTQVAKEVANYWCNKATGKKFFYKK